MRRTIGEARRALEVEVAPTVNDPQLRELTAFLEAAEAKARQKADEYVAERETEVLAGRDAALRELTATRDGYDELAGEGAKGRISATDYARALQALASRQGQAEAALATVAERVAAIAAIEDDAVAWYDALTVRLPRLKGDFPW